ncbi:MAG: hypothetical protein Harvfovirus18_18 [Harvfovirus sp.]|uniref:Sel1 repeat family protein n=1 Tax=Harvfovirus sp. TaxID=2487768 RepID=A0A3G5A1Z7_9VIRU|nr:MAG: hypothetical protein Harvfovirus18_18 [Harvfovirus sp.]
MGKSLSKQYEAQMNPFDLTSQRRWWIDHQDHHPSSPFDYSPDYRHEREVYLKTCRKHVDEKGDPNAAFLLGIIFCAEPFDINLAMHYLTIAVKGGNKNALYPLAQVYYFGSTQIAANRKFLNVIQPTNRYPHRHKQSPLIPFEQDLTKSFELFLESVDFLKDSIPAVYMFIGKFYEQGVVIPRDYKKAMDYYQKAWILGYKECLFEIYTLFIEEKGHELNSDDAVEWIQESTKTMFTAHYYLAKIYEARENYVDALDNCEKQMTAIKNNPMREKYEFFEKVKNLRQALREKNLKK